VAHGGGDGTVTDGRDWDAALDAFEARLHDQLSALGGGGDPVVPPFDPPVMTAPMPDHLVERAHVLLQRCRDIEADIQMALGDVTASLERSAEQPAGSAGDQQPVYFDSRV
jgi:hypothetical protein